MPETPKVTLRLSPTLRRAVARLSRKLNINEANVIRLAITRMAEAEGVLRDEKRS